MVATLSPTAAQIKAAKPDYIYGVTSPIQLQSAAASGLVRIGMPADIPSNAVISQALLVVTQSADFTGAQTIEARRLTARWSLAKDATWNAAPSSTSTTTLTKTGSLKQTAWSLDVTADVSAFIAGTVTNYGWRLSTSSSSALNFYGSSTSTAFAPQLVISYLVPGDAPDGQTPDGNSSVSIAKPVLQFQVPADTVSINVQVDADATSPYDFDSGEIPATAGQVDLSTTAYSGLAVGSSTYWRARAKSALGWSAWSDWAQFKRTAKPTVSITSPGATADDTTPPVAWSALGQASWQVIITKPNGKVVADSGRVVGTTSIWTPPQAISKEGASATVEVRVWDSVDRIATPGDDVYANATQTYTLTGTGAVSPAVSVYADSDGFTPKVTVTATRATAPDKWRLIRDGVRLYTSTTTGNPFSMDDWTADPNKEHVYQMAPVITGTGTASGGPTATITPTCQGIWLVDPADPTKRAAIWGVDEGTWDSTELAVIHQPIAGPPIRRVAYRPPAMGSVTGDLIDVGDILADDSIAALYDFKSDDRDLQLVLGDRNLTVRVGDINIPPLPSSSGTVRHSKVSFTWWQQGDAPWSP